jgi:hypothetical protein
MDEKIQRAYDLLNVERHRLNLEGEQLREELRRLKNLGANAAAIDEGMGEEGGDVLETEVRDVATDSGFAEGLEPYLSAIRRKFEHVTAWTLFDGPGRCESDRVPDVSELLAEAEGESAGPLTAAVHVDVNAITVSVLNRCQEVIERQLAQLLGAMGVKIDRNDIAVMVRQLRVLDELQQDSEALKAKMILKVDQSLMVDMLRNYITRDEFFAKTGDQTVLKLGPKPKPVPTRRPVTPSKPVVNLVPARNPLMLGVNDRFLKGKDNKLYLRETTTIGDRSFREPSLTGQPRSYYDRAKTALEIDGIEAVLDFQPFVPAEEARPNSRLRVETYDFGDGT